MADPVAARRVIDLTHDAGQLQSTQGLLARRAWKAEFDDQLNVPSDVKRWVRPLGQAGFFARAVVFFAAGRFLIIATWTL